MTQETASFEDDPLYESFFKAFESHLFNPLHNRDEDAFAFLLINPQDIRPDHGKLEEIFRHCYESEFPSDPELIRVLLKVLGIKPGSRPPSPSADPYGQILHTVSLEQIQRHILASFKAAVLEVQVSHQSEGRIGTIEVGPRKAKTFPNLDIKSGDQEKKFSLQKIGEKELCIVVSYFKAAKHDLKKLAGMLTHKGKIKYRQYEFALEWYQKDYKGFKNHVSKLRKKAQDQGLWEEIPPEYHRSYL